jgi:serine/threonine protein phosphatase PrpC
MTPVIIGASVRGESHIRHDVERQDSYRIIDASQRPEGSGDPEDSGFYGSLSKDIRIVSVADGHGSASCPYSRTGSQTAVDVFCDIMAELSAKYREDMQSLFAALHREGETAKLSQHIVREWGARILRIHAAEGREVSYAPDGSIDAEAIWKQYGTTLLGMLVTESFLFSMQLGDGDITYVDEDGVSPVIEGDKILGVETHSISKPGSWKKVLTRVISPDHPGSGPCMYVLSTDGWMNSHVSGAAFTKTCRDYFDMIREHGADVVEKNLPVWLAETSALGCGDDITTVFIYYDTEGRRELDGDRQ